MYHNTSERPTPQRYRDMLILTDPYNSKRSNAVFPLYREAFYLADHLKVPKGSLVLDLCTGSGIVALFAARKARKIISTDISPRALSMAHFNAAVNGVDKKIEFRQGDLFNPVEGILFDLIAVNPPLQTSKEKWASGKTLTQYIIKNVDKYLCPKGSLQMISYIPDEALHLLDFLKERFRKVKVKWLDKKYKVERPSNEDYEHMNYLFIYASIKKVNT